MELELPVSELCNRDTALQWIGLCCSSELQDKGRHSLNAGSHATVGAGELRKATVHLDQYGHYLGKSSSSLHSPGGAASHPLCGQLRKPSPPQGPASRLDPSSLCGLTVTLPSTPCLAFGLLHTSHSGPRRTSSHHVQPTVSHSFKIYCHPLKDLASPSLQSLTCATNPAWNALILA